MLVGMTGFLYVTINSNHCRPTRQYSYLYCCNWFLHILRISSKHHRDSRLTFKLSSFSTVRAQKPFINQKNQVAENRLLKKWKSEKFEKVKIWKLRHCERGGMTLLKCLTAEGVIGSEMGVTQNSIKELKVAWKVAQRNLNKTKGLTISG